MVVKNDLFDYKGYVIYQDTNFFKFSLDSVLLSEFSLPLKDNLLICDLCAGNMAIPLILSNYTKSKIVGFEIQKEVYDLGIMSINANDLLHQLELINDDVKNINKYFKSETFDVMVCNPPYFKCNDHLLNGNINKQIARHELYLTLEDIFKIAKTYLKNKGSLYIVHRAERLDDIINVASKYSIYVKKIQLISTKEAGKPYLLLVKCVKNSNPGVKFNNQMCIENIKSYQNIFKESK